MYPFTIKTLRGFRRVVTWILGATAIPPTRSLFLPALTWFARLGALCAPQTPSPDPIFAHGVLIHVYEDDVTYGGDWYRLKGRIYDRTGRSALGSTKSFTSCPAVLLIHVFRTAVVGQRQILELCKDDETKFRMSGHSVRICLHFTKSA